MKIRIYQPAKNAMQSGRTDKKWKISFEGSHKKPIDPLMGWVGLKDMPQELNLQFDTLESAELYAKKHSFNYDVIRPKMRKISPKSYALNFSNSRVPLYSSYK